MGLDIFFHKVKKVRTKGEPFEMTIKEVAEYNDKKAKERFGKFYKKELKNLAAALEKGESEYEKAYKSIFPSKMSKQTRFEFYYAKMAEKVHDFNEVEQYFKAFYDRCFAEEDAYFRKVNFVYAFFMPYLEDECCFVTRAQVEELIDRCKKVKADHTLAPTLLPTQAGFFFGSTDYDEWYYRDIEDVIKQMTNLLKGYDEDTDVIYVVMSW